MVRIVPPAVTTTFATQSAIKIIIGIVRHPSDTTITIVSIARLAVAQRLRAPARVSACGTAASVQRGGAVTAAHRAATAHRRRCIGVVPKG